MKKLGKLKTEFVKNPEATVGRMPAPLQQQDTSKQQRNTSKQQTMEVFDANAVNGVFVSTLEEGVAEGKNAGKRVNDCQKISEDAVANAAGSGAVAGLGVGPQGEPGGDSSMIIKRKKFAGHDVFEVSADWFHKARLGKKKHARYELYVGNDKIGEEIRSYATENYGKPVIIQDERSGAMCYLRYGKK